MLGPVVRLQSYKNILYLLLAFPLGFFYWMILGFGLILGIGLSIVLVGLVILGVLLVLDRVLGGVERSVSNKLLGVHLARPDESLEPGGLLSSTRSYVDAGSTWRALGFLSLKIWLGIIGLIFLFAFSTAASMVRSLIDRPRDIEFGELNGEPIEWTVDSVPEVVVAALFGLVIVLVILHLANLFGYVAGRMSHALLQ